jgi:DNA-directed RNA polymerase subunit beta
MEQTRHSFDLSFEESAKKLTWGDGICLPACSRWSRFTWLSSAAYLQRQMAGRPRQQRVWWSKDRFQLNMPHMADGTPCDIVLNPLGVPSRI